MIHRRSARASNSELFNPLPSVRAVSPRRAARFAKASRSHRLDMIDVVISSCYFAASASSPRSLGQKPHAAGMEALPQPPFPFPPLPPRYRRCNGVGPFPRAVSRPLSNCGGKSARIVSGTTKHRRRQSENGDAGSSRSDAASAADASALEEITTP